MSADASATTVQPTGLGRTLLAVTLLFPLPTAVIVSMRCWVRYKHRNFGVDDGLMLFGWMLYIGVTGIVARATYAGLGTKDADLNPTLQSDGRKYLWFFQVTYCCSVIFIKGSICLTLRRIAVERIHRIIIWATLTFTTLSTLTVIIGLFLICHPISAAWGHPGICAPTRVIASLGYLVSTGAVVTDWSCAILPGFMLYKTRMKRATKISITIILGLGVLASVATIIRMPFVKAYTRPHNYLYNVANIVIWSIFESAIGIIACSLPSLRQLFKHRFLGESSEQSPGQVAPDSGTNSDLVTCNTVGGTRYFYRAPTSATTAESNWERLGSQGMFAQVDVEMQALQQPAAVHKAPTSSKETAN